MRLVSVSQIGIRYGRLAVLSLGDASTTRGRGGRSGTNCQITGVEQSGSHLSRVDNDGSSKFRFLVTPVRIVCANTQSAATSRAAASFGISHTGGASIALQKARRALKLSWRCIEAFEQEAVALYAAPMDLEAMGRFAAQLVDVDGAESKATARNRRDTANSIVKLWVSSPTVEPILSCQLRMTRPSCAGRCVENAFVTHRSPLPRSCRSPDR